ncbi:hypothetical protein [Pseudomonas fluorescens]|uniref:hypothetical protein n=1 Tax=Pseudomonas fluorescens TaxID=294 RepID=UPI00125163DC|nr:hypothetical protein [Pseudomonas fluorescens]VVO75821.1 hypothetical protein PS843_01518 [Pseudomonas fluorescens]
MSRGKEFFQAMTKTQLKEVIRSEIAAVNFGQEFQSSLIADLIHQKHYHCAAQGLRPTRFRKLHRPGAVYDFQGYFPGYGWHGVSWTQCIDPRDEMAWLNRALRDAAHPIISRYRAMHPVCERCKNNPSTEVDHVSPEFHVMVTQIIQTLSPSQIEEIFSRFDWLDKDPFSLPSGHSVLQLLDEAHQTVTLQAVCKPCHVCNGNDRRR